MNAMDSSEARFFFPASSIDNHHTLKNYYDMTLKINNSNNRIIQVQNNIKLKYSLFINKKINSNIYLILNK
jgi:hypothetical protein